MQMSRDMHMGALAGGNSESMVAARHCEAGRRGEHRFESHSMQNRCGPARVLWHHDMFQRVEITSDLCEELPRLVWRIIEMGKKDVRIRDFMRRDSSRYTVMRWFADWVEGPFPPETRNIVLDQWAASLLPHQNVGPERKARWSG